LGLALLAGLAIVSLRAAAQAPVTLKYYYPVGVSGPLNKLMTDMVSDFNGSHAGTHVEPVVAGNYVEAMAKAMTAVMGGTPSDLAVLDTPELFSLLDRDAIRPLDDLVAQSGGKAWLDDFFNKIPPDHVAASWSFIRWMTEPAQAARWSIGTGYVPIRKTELSAPPFAAYIKEVPQALTATLRVAGEQMTIHDVDQIGLMLVTAIQAAQTGRLGAQAALDQAQRDATAVLAKYQ
jgi:ABC-type glycerol-3-phosphate transport system substrate-binding protein